MPTNSRLEPADDSRLLRLFRAVADDDSKEAGRLIKAFPALAGQPLGAGATRQSETDFFFEQVKHYFYAGDTPLHAAAAGYRLEIARQLIKEEANVRTANRRGAEPLHYAADGAPGSGHWNPRAQAGMIELLIHAGADANALDKSGVAPLHRAVRQRCIGAVDALLKGGAAVRLRNKSGSTPLHLAVQNTGRGGTGSAKSKDLQREIIRLLLGAGASPQDRDGRGRTVRQAAQGKWISEFL
jgi:Ankyrin repeats (3 copies)